MTVELHTSSDLLQQDLYRPIAVTTGARHVYLAGQVGVYPSGEVAAPDMAGQVRAAVGNVVAAVRSIGGEPADIARMTAFVVGWSPTTQEPFERGLAEAQAEHGLADPLPPLTVIGVQALYRPELFVEVEGIAVLD